MSFERSYTESRVVTASERALASARGATVRRERVLAAAAPLRIAREAPRLRIVATINGPGEVAAWLFPFAAALAERDPNARLDVALLPCVFASGAERRVLDAMTGVDSSCAPGESIRWIFRGDVPHAMQGEAPACVLHFGGELLLSVMLARRLGTPLVVYSEERVRWSSLVDRVCFANRALLDERVDPKARVVGNLMVDAAHRRVPMRRPSAHQTIALFPGSRPYQVRNMLPFLLQVAGDVARERRDVRWTLAQSDFISRDELAAFASAPGGRVLDGEAARLERRAGRDVLVTDRIEVDVASSADAMRGAALALTIPGTNTAELAALGIPMLLLLPTYQLHTIPLPGIAGHLGGVPFFGPLIKRAVAESYLRTRRHWAHPNRIAREHVVPELVGRITPEGVARDVLSALDSGLAATSRRLREVMGGPGGADRLVTEVLRTAGAASPSGAA